MKPKLFVLVFLNLAVLLLGPGPSLGMIETFCSCPHNQWAEYNLTLLIRGSRTSWYVQVTAVQSVPRSVKPIVQTSPERASLPESFPQVMVQRVRQGGRVLGILTRVAARLVKHYLQDQAQSLKPTGRD